MAFEYLTRTPSVAGNRRTFTISQWMKFPLNNLNQKFYSTSAGAGTSNRSFFWMIAADYLQCGAYYSSGGGWQNYIDTLPLLRDTNNWYHLMCAIDTTQSNASDRIKIWVNGNLQAIRNSAYPTQNFEYDVNHTTQQWIGSAGGSGGNSQSEYVNAYMNDFFLIDGLALTPSTFGKNDSRRNNQWVPKHPTAIISAINIAGGFGNNGVYLPLNDSTNIGKDMSGNSRNWTPTNFSNADVVKDNVHNNFCTLNILSRESSPQAFGSNGGLSITGGNDCFGTLAFSSGKWYFESKRTNNTESFHIGWIDATDSIKSTNPWQTQACVAMWRNDGYFSYNANSVGDNGGILIDNGSIIGCAIDHDNKIATFYKDGTLIKTINYSSYPAASFTAITPWIRNNDNVTGEYNFGQGFHSWVTNSYTDANGKGKFQYQPPSGFLALCEDNLTDPTNLAAKSPSSYFKAFTFTGNSSNGNVITGLPFKADLLWFKNRTLTDYPNIFDSVRGAPYRIFPNDNQVENNSTTTLVSFNSNGFTLNSNTNVNGTSMIAYCWKASNTTVSNTNGSVTSTVSVSTDAGFSIVKYNTGSNSGVYTVGHGLNKAPEFILLKGGYDSNTYNWECYHTSIGPTVRLKPNSLDGQESQQGPWNNTTPTSTIFTQNNLSNSWYGANKNCIAYCWTSIEGFSRFGKYIGTGSTDGPFVYTGFKPAFVIIKRVDSGSTDWCLLDSTRNTYNVVSNQIRNQAIAEDTGGEFVDFYSNGFKPRNNASDKNASGGTYVYAAWAESPFDFSNAL